MLAVCHVHGFCYIQGFVLFRVCMSRVCHVQGLSSPVFVIQGFVTKQSVFLLSKVCHVYTVYCRDNKIGSQVRNVPLCASHCRQRHSASSGKYRNYISEKDGNSSSITSMALS
jgi:hypothetical protein